MTRTITRIDPIQAGKVLGVLYAILGLLVLPFVVLSALFGEQGAAGLVLGLFFPILYGVMGFVGSIIGAALYNFVAARVGGIAIEVSQVE